MTSSRPSSEPTRQPTRHRVVLRLLDHQVVGPDGELVGNVDDVELAISEDGWFVTALLVGPAALGGRLPGKLGRWTVAIWLRLQTSPDPRPARVPLAEVRDIGSAITVSGRASELLGRSFGLEGWLRRYVVTRIPGATGGGDERAGGGGHERSGVARQEGADDAGRVGTTDLEGQPLAPVVARSRPQTHSAAAVIAARVLGRDGAELGRVLELVCLEPARGAPRDHLRVTHVQYGRHRSWSRLGYESDPRQGPLLVGAVVRRWQRGHRIAPVEDVELDLRSGTLTVASPASQVHPHAL